MYRQVTIGAVQLLTEPNASSFCEFLFDSSIESAARLTAIARRGVPRGHLEITNGTLTTRGPVRVDTRTRGAHNHPRLCNKHIDQHTRAWDFVMGGSRLRALSAGGHSLLFLEIIGA